MELLPASDYLTTIVTELRKFRYNRVPMGLCAYSDIFQARVNNILSDIKGLNTYTNNIIVLGKWSL